MLVAASDSRTVRAVPLITAQSLQAGYAPGQLALDGVDFAVEPGERVAVLGPNGGGKTTLFAVLDGSLAPGSGSVSAPRCALVAQTERTRLDFPVSALDVAMMGALARLPWYRRPRSQDRDAALAALERVNAATLAERTFGELSGGQRQRVLIARAIVERSEVLLLDEPFNGLDTQSAAALDSLIEDLAGEGRVLLIATHDTRQAARWDKVLCLNKRQIAFGTPAETLTSDVLEKTYGGEIVHLQDGSAVLTPCHHHDHEH